MDLHHDHVRLHPILWLIDTEKHGILSNIQIVKRDLVLPLYLFHPLRHPSLMGQTPNKVTFCLDSCADGRLSLQRRQRVVVGLLDSRIEYVRLE